MLETTSEREEGYAFHLFRPANKAGPTSPTRPQSVDHDVPKIRLTTPPPASTIAVERPLSHYIYESTSNARQRFQVSAVDGAHIKARAERPCPGLAYSWRIKSLRVGRNIILKLGSDASSNAVDANSNVEKSKRRRVGKKTRIRRRILARKVEDKRRNLAAKEAERQLKKKERGEHLKVKKAKENRRRQLKKREKAREGRKAGNEGEHEGTEAREAMADNEPAGDEDDYVEE